MALAASLVSKSTFSIGISLTPWMQVSQARRDLVGLIAVFCSIDFNPLYVVTTVFLLKLIPIPSDERQFQSSAV